MSKRTPVSIRSVLSEGELRAAYAEMTIFSDAVANLFFGDAPTAQYVLRAVTEQEDLEVRTVKTQHAIENPMGHSVRFDVLASDSQGNLYDIEIQNVSGADLLLRADYYGASMKMRYFEKNKPYGKMPKVYVIFFVKDGGFCKNKLINHYFMRDDEGADLGFGTRIYLVNGSLRDETRVGKMMHDFSCADPERMRDAVIAQRFRQIKRAEEKKMDAFSQMIFERGLGIGERQGIAIGEERGEERGIAIGERQGIAIGEASSRRAIAAEMLRRGMSEELTASITGLDAESVKKLASEAF